MVEFSALNTISLEDYRTLNPSVQGTLGLITINNDVFLCVVSGASRVASVRPGESVQRISSVDFHCLNRSDYDHVLSDEINPYPTDNISQDGFEQSHGHDHREPILEHPCLALKKLLSSGTFYYSVNFDITKRLQDRSNETSAFDIENLDEGFLWNSYMIGPLVRFRSRLAINERAALDSSQILTSAIRGFVLTITVPASTSPIGQIHSGLPSTLTLISRLSCRRAGTRFNARGIDDDGNVANFVETEVVFWAPSGVCFSYAQVRGSVPVFWEQATGLLPGQQKIQITRSPEATQPAFDKHFDGLEVSYGMVHVLNLLSESKPGEVELTNRYRYHVRHSSLNRTGEKGASADQHLLHETEFDFHAETKGPGGYEAASMVKTLIEPFAEGFAYYLSEGIDHDVRNMGSRQGQESRRSVVVLQQGGIFRTNCLDCLDRTNLIQTIISQMALEAFLAHRGERVFMAIRKDKLMSYLQSLSKIYAGTGALKSSFTRHGKMSLAGAIADARKSATRMYINNFADKGRQNTMDILLGRLMGQTPVHLYDPINDYVTSELIKRVPEFTSSKSIHVLVGTFNLNGQANDIPEDLSAWLCPEFDGSQMHPEIVAVGFQEIVELSPQQIMSTDPARRQTWEHAVKKTLNGNSRKFGKEEYVLLRSGQLVGAALLVFVKAIVLGDIKDVEGSVKKVTQFSLCSISSAVLPLILIQTGMSGMAGNKGAVAIRMDFANTSMCFVTAHLAAGFANYEERNRDYRTINHGLRFQRNRSIEDHDTIIWLGDFNYRIGLGDERVRKLIRMGDLDTLYENDQLNLQMVAGLTFPFYSEARITFMPTYKYNNGTDDYDTSEKARIPAWCDRVLRKGDNLRQINYSTAPLRFSDHRPVYATFLCSIKVVDEVLKEQISRDLYEKRRSDVGNAMANSKLVDTDDEDLIGYDSIAPGLPPASSDRRKWWLDNGLPARAILKALEEDYVPNPQRRSNPFTPTTEPVWIKKPVDPRSRGISPASESFASAKDGSPRNVSSSYNPPQSTTGMRSGSTVVSGDPIHEAGSAIEPISNMTIPRQLNRDIARKPAPPIPQKPSPLASRSSHGSNFASDGSQFPQRVLHAESSNFSISSEKTSTATPTGVKLPPPPPRRASNDRFRSPFNRQSPPLPQPIASKKSSDNHSDDVPALPLRRQASSAEQPNDLMDERDDGLRRLDSWQPLRPQ
ncbi:MAG: inositol polyphosphate 5-phosphatase [Pleopsidium flavum]|nr:MAG: inositol polyphosphate 5-phosphatase [Pleopsidium flavum]